MGQHSWRRWWHRLVLGLRLAPGAMVLGRYRVERLLGTGTYGFAYLVGDRTGGPAAVLKVSSPVRGDSRKAREIRRRETEALQMLVHSGIPKLYEVFELGGYPCFTMEYAEGDSLDALLFRDNKVFSEGEALRLVLRLLPVIVAVHDAGWLHRDISIANVIVQEVGDGDSSGGSNSWTVRLIDFGLARPIPEHSDPGVLPDDLESDWPSITRMKRQLHVTADFYALGHLLLFLLYSSFGTEPSPGGRKPTSKEEREPPGGWEQELDLSPGTRSLLRRLLGIDEPYASLSRIEEDMLQALQALELEQP